MVFNSAMSEGSGEDSNYFLRKIFHWTYMREATIVPRKLSICGKSFSCKLCEKNYFKKLKYGPLNFLKIVFRNLVLLKAPEVVCLPISNRK
jgi:hypothetical protein